MDIDWTLFDRRLVETCVSAIQSFAIEHAGTEVRCFFLDCDDPKYGHVFISLDSSENNAQSARNCERWAVESRTKMLEGPNAWRQAKYFLSSPALTPFETNGGGFQFREYAEVEFPEWIELDRNGYPSGGEHDDDYLESNARLVLWRTIEQLVSENAFDSLTLASPMLVGYSLHDSDDVIVRMINWSKTKVGESGL